MTLGWPLMLSPALPLEAEAKVEAKAEVTQAEVTQVEVPSDQSAKS